MTAADDEFLRGPEGIGKLTREPSSLLTTLADSTLLLLILYLFLLPKHVRQHIAGPPNPIQSLGPVAHEK